MMMLTFRPDAHYRAPKGGQVERYDEQGIGDVSNFILPQGWARITLEDVAEWSSGGTPSRSVPSYFTGSIPWIKTGELGEKYLYDAEEKISEEAINNSSAKVFPKGSIALAMYGATIGKLSIFAIEASTNQACAVAIPISEIIDTLFLFYFLHFQRQAFVDAGKGGAQPNISQGIIKAWPFNLPPRNEQSRIVEKLEELLSDLDAGVAELKAAQKKLTQYRQSLLKAAVEGALTAEWRAERAKRGEPLETGAQLLERILAERRRHWEEKQLAKFKEQGKTPPKDWRDKYPEPAKPNTADLPELPEGWVWMSAGCLIAEIETGKSFKCDERPPTSNEIGVVKVSSVSWGEYDEQESKTCTDLDRVNEALFVRPGDFLFSRANTIELVGACVIASTVTLRVMLSDKILRFIFVVNGLNKWLLFLLRSDLGRFQIEALASGNQESMRNIGQERIRQIAVPVGSREIMLTLEAAVCWNRGGSCTI